MNFPNFTIQNTFSRLQCGHHAGEFRHLNKSGYLCALQYGAFPVKYTGDGKQYAYRP